jgi:hypothetical protein
VRYALTRAAPHRLDAVERRGCACTHPHVSTTSTALSKARMQAAVASPARVHNDFDTKYPHKTAHGDASTRRGVERGCFQTRQL